MEVVSRWQKSCSCRPVSTSRSKTMYFVVLLWPVSIDRVEYAKEMPLSCSNTESYNDEAVGIACVNAIGEGDR